MRLDVGGDGPTVSSSVEICGCSCRHDDFVIALVRFAMQWRKESDMRAALATKPCGCDEVDELH